MMDGWGHGGWGWVAMALFWAGLLLIVFLAIRAWGPSRGPGPSERPDPRHILDERFARGELDEDEYRERRKVLDEAKTSKT